MSTAAFAVLFTMGTICGIGRYVHVIYTCLSHVYTQSCVFTSVFSLSFTFLPSYLIPLISYLPSSTLFLVGPITQVKKLWSSGDVTASLIKISCIAVLVLMIALVFCTVFWVSVEALLIMCQSYVQSCTLLQYMYNTAEPSYQTPTF